MDDSKPKILIFDIETKPALSYHWRLFKENIGLDQIKEPGGILCVGVKWFGETQITTYSEWEHGEKGMLEKVHALLQECDMVVGKNSIRFDLPWLMAEFVKHKLPPVKPLTHLDLEKAIRGKFKFLSNKLDFIAQYLELGSKLEHEGFKLWRKVMDGNEAARKKMLRYCAHDVRITDRLYKRLRPYITDHPVMRSLGSEACPTCTSKRTKKDGIRRTKCYHVQNHQCNDCGTYFSGKRWKVV